MARFFHLSRSAQRLLYKTRHHRGHGIHSPFVFDLINKVIEEKYPFYAYELIDQHLKSYSQEKLYLKKHNLLSFRLINYFNSKKILEIGAGKGVNTICLTAPASDIECKTFEISDEEREKSQKLFANWCRNVELITDLHKLENKQDCIVINLDNIKNLPTNIIDYLQPLIEQNTFILVHGIRENKDNHKIWQQLSEMQHRTAKLDLFNHGILFFDKRLYRWEYQISF